MKHKKFLFISIASIILLTSCTNDSKNTSNISPNNNIENKSEISSIEKKDKNKDKNRLTIMEDDKYFVVNDYQSVETKIPKNFSKPAVLSGTPLTIWYDLGGKSVVTSRISDNLKLDPKYEDEIKNLPEAGAVFSLNMEAVISENPDLIIAQVGTQADYAKKFRDMGYPVITTYIKTFEDVINTYESFGKLLNNEKKAKEKIDRLVNRRNELISMAPKEPKSIVILYVTANNVAAKLNKSIAGDIAKSLGIKNILENAKPDKIGSENAYLDVEYILEHQPDIILVTSMVSDNEEAKRIIENEFETNPVWKGVKAIENKNIVYLPQQYFLYNSGPFYDEAIEYLARAVYPEIYGSLSEFNEK